MRGLKHREVLSTWSKWPSKSLNSGSLAQEPALLTTMLESAHKSLCVDFKNWQLEIRKQTLRTILMTFSFPHGRLYPEGCEKKLNLCGE